MNGPKIRRSRGFSLVELGITVVVVALILGAILVTLGTQLDQRMIVENKAKMQQAREALLGFAVAKGRFPCPDDMTTTTSKGKEEFSDEPNGVCAQQDGYLPGVTLGLSGLDEKGLLRDGWGGEYNAIRYAITIGLGRSFTKPNGIKALSVTQIGGANDLLWVCASSSGIDTVSCGTTAQELSNGKAIVVIYSLGKNATQVESGVLTPDADEQANRDGDRVFVSHSLVTATGVYFDDQVEWIGASVLISHAIAAGLLP